MNFLVLWLGSTAFSFCMEISRELRMFKDVADAGYKLDVEKLSSFIKEFNPDVNKNTILSMLIPIYNIMNAFQNDLNYNKIRYMLLDQLYIMDVLDEMSEYEKKEYQKNPTGLNACLLQIKMKLKLMYATKIEFPDSSVIYCDIKEDDIIIYKAEGPISRLSKEEQKQKIKEVCIKMGKLVLNKYDSIDEFVEDIKAHKNGSLKLSQTDNKESESDKYSSREDKINTLRTLKDELLGQKEAVDQPYRRERKK